MGFAQDHVFLGFMTGRLDLKVTPMLYSSGIQLDLARCIADQLAIQVDLGSLFLFVFKYKCILRAANDGGTTCEIISSGINRIGKYRKCFIWFMVMDFYNIGVPL